MHLDADSILPQSGLSFGVGGIEFFSRASVLAEQSGYDGPGWQKSWLVIAHETACGDPIFLDQSKIDHPVFTAMHGAGSWEPSLVASSWAQFLAALEFARPYTKDRENPVGLEQRPFNQSEHKELLSGLSKILGSPLPIFWDVLFTP
ncbi:SMI1/KNR4 family protein [Rhodanobacter sp. L36]|uniref:SMI1/KNR4 family protein n=1 Tax=Rhodanobacter sp. L36 TaxID=1747221 RepID=UPI00131A7A4B|nr:SMI1/KNR4 family protein [Rhodanobacter sp. L36]